MDRFFAGLEKKGKVLVFGHRGMSQYYPENTMLSFSKCAENPSVDGVELDVHVCRSGEVVVAHDFSLKRTAGIDREIEEFTLDELKQIDVGSFKGEGFSGCRIPLLGELFSAFGDRFVYDVELKVKAGKVNRELCAKVWDLIREYNLEDTVLVSSFNPFALRAFRSVSHGAIPTADIYEDAPSIPRALRHGAGHLVSRSTFRKPCFRQIDGPMLEKHRNLPAVTWTVNDREEALRLLGLNKGGMRVFGLIGNDPLMLAEAVSHCIE